MSLTNEPFAFNVTFDSNAPDLCGAGSSAGDYAASSASLTLLGYRYTLSGFAESHSIFVNCIPGGGTLFRFFVLPGTPQPTGPGGTQLDLRNVGFPVSAGFAVIFLPDPPVTGSLPTTLPFQPFPVGVEFFSDGTLGTHQLTATGVTATVRTVPEPSALALVALGLSAAIRRKVRPSPGPRGGPRREPTTRRPESTVRVVS